MGALVGFGAKKLFNKEYVYNNVDFDAFVPDYNAIFEEVNSYKGSSKEKVDHFSAVEVINYSLEKFRRNEKCATYTYGISHTAVEQIIRGANYKVGSEYFEESLSKSSLVSVANRVYMSGTSGDIKMYKGADDSIVINDKEAFAEYPEATEDVIEHDTYKKTYGKTLDEMFIYLICNDGVLSSSVNETGSGYQYVVNLDNEISTYFNKLQMKNISDLDTYPVFQTVTLTFDLDKDLSLKKCNIDEYYKVKKIISASAHALIDIYFVSNADIEIPAVNEKLNYDLEF